MDSNLQLVKLAHYQLGFQTRLMQMAVKSAMWPEDDMIKEAGPIAKTLGFFRGIPRVISTGFGKLRGGFQKWRQGVSRDYLRSWQQTAGGLPPEAQARLEALDRLWHQRAQTAAGVGGARTMGAEEWGAAGFGKGREGMDEFGHNPATNKFTYGPGPAVGGGPHPRTNEELAAAGMGSAPWRQGMFSNLPKWIPQGARNWAEKNPEWTAGLLGGGIGAGATEGLNMYGDAKRRNRIQNLGFLQRLGLAGQLAFDPSGFTDTLHL